MQRKDPATPVECSLYAQAKSYERVAEHTFTVDPGTEVLTVVHVDLKTIKEATTISMEEPAYGCSTDRLARCLILLPTLFGSRRRPTTTS